MHLMEVGYEDEK